MFFKRSGKVTNLSPQQLLDKQGDFRLVDVRQPEELRGELGCIDGVENIPLSELLDDIDGALSRRSPVDHDKPVVLICRSGARSGTAASALAKHGYSNVYNLKGGMMAYRAFIGKKTR